MISKLVDTVYQWVVEFKGREKKEKIPKIEVRTKPKPKPRIVKPAPPPPPPPRSSTNNYMSAMLKVHDERIEEISEKLKELDIETPNTSSLSDDSGPS